MSKRLLTQLRSDSIQVCAENLRPGKEKNIKISAELMKRVDRVYVCIAN